MPGNTTETGKKTTVGRGMFLPCSPLAERLKDRFSWYIEFVQVLRGPDPESCVNGTACVGRDELGGRVVD